MKKIVLTAAFVATLFFGSTGAFADNYSNKNCTAQDTTSTPLVVKVYDKAKDGTVKTYEKVADGTVKVYNTAEKGTVKTYDKAKKGTKKAYNAVKDEFKKIF